MNFCRRLMPVRMHFTKTGFIVVTSNHGGSADGRYGGTSEVERNTFGLFYYNHYTEKQLNGNRLYGAYFDSQNNTRLSFLIV